MTADGFVRGEIEERIYRMRVYRDELGRDDLLAWLESLRLELEQCDESEVHDDCRTQEEYQDLEREVDQLKERIAELEVQAKPKRRPRLPKTLPVNVLRFDDFRKAHSPF